MAALFGRSLLVVIKGDTAAAAASPLQPILSFFSRLPTAAAQTFIIPTNKQF